MPARASDSPSTESFIYSEQILHFLGHRVAMEEYPQAAIPSRAISGLTAGLGLAPLLLWGG